MSLPIARIGDLVVNGVIITARGTRVITCGLPTHVQGDLHLVHKGSTICIAPLIMGSPKTLVQGCPVGRIGDPDSCPSVILTGCGKTVSF